MKKITAILITLLLSLTFVQSAFAEMFLFVGEGCSHCAIVEQYLQQGDLVNKFQIKILETWYHPENQAIRDQKAKEVGYAEGGVPLLINGTEFRVGDSPIINYLDSLQNKGPVNTPGTNVPGDTTPLPSGNLTANDSSDLKDALADIPTTADKSFTGMLKENAIYIVVIIIAAGFALYFAKKSKNRNRRRR